MIDRSFIELNRASTERIRKMARLSDTQMRTRLGAHWTVSIMLAHLAFWERRVSYVLDSTERDHKLIVTEIDIFVNDLSLPLWAAIPGQAAARLALESAQAVDQRLEAYPMELLDEIYAYNPRWVVRARHRNEHLDEADAALGHTFFI